MCIEKHTLALREAFRAIDRGESGAMTTDTNILTADRVNSIFMDCLFKDGEDTSGHIVAEGIVQTVGLHPGRVEVHHLRGDALRATA